MPGQHYQSRLRTPKSSHVCVVLTASLIMVTSGQVFAGKKVDVENYIAEGGKHVVRVEEHWKVRVSFPDPAKDLPQFSFVLTPTRDFNGPHMVVALNHHTEPQFAPGGVQLQSYDGPQLISVHSKLHGKRLWQTDDDIEVRMAIEVVDGALKYEVFKLKGKSWGDNKDSQWLFVSQPTSLPHLDNYDAALTHTWTGAGAGVHCLEKAEVTKVRYTFSDGKDIDVDEYKTKIEYQPAVTYKSYDE
jgi:hypothetical protein